MSGGLEIINKYWISLVELRATFALSAKQFQMLRQQYENTNTMRIADRYEM